MKVFSKPSFVRSLARAIAEGEKFLGLNQLSTERRVLYSPRRSFRKTCGNIPENITVIDGVPDPEQMQYFDTTFIELPHSLVSDSLEARALRIDQRRKIETFVYHTGESWNIESVVYVENFHKRSSILETKNFWLNVWSDGSWGTRQHVQKTSDGYEFFIERMDSL